MVCDIESNDNILNAIVKDSNPRTGIYVDNNPISFVFTSFDVIEPGGSERIHFRSVRDEKRSKFAAKPLSLDIVKSAHKWLTGEELPVNQSGEEQTLEEAFRHFISAMKEVDALNESQDSKIMFEFIKNREWPVDKPQTNASVPVLRKFIQDHFSQMTKIAGSPYDGLHRTAATKICTEGTLLNGIENNLRDSITNYSLNVPHIAKKIECPITYDLLTEEISDEILEDFRRMSIGRQNDQDKATSLGIFMYLNLVMGETKNTLTRFYKCGEENDYHLLTQLNDLMKLQDLGKIIRTDNEITEEKGAKYKLENSVLLLGLLEALITTIISARQDDQMRIREMQSDEAGHEGQPLNIRGGARKRVVPSRSRVLWNEVHLILFMNSKSSKDDIARTLDITMSAAVTAVTHLWTKAVLCCMKLAFLTTSKFTPKSLQLLNGSSWKSVQTNDLFDRFKTQREQNALFPILFISSEKLLLSNQLANLVSNNGNVLYGKMQGKKVLTSIGLDMVTTVFLSFMSDQSYATIKQCITIKSETTKQTRSSKLDSEKMWLRLFLHATVSSAIKSRDVFVSAGAIVARSQIRKDYTKERIQYLADLFLLPGAIECTCELLHMLGQNPVMPDNMPRLNLEQIAQDVFSGLEENESTDLKQPDLRLFLKSLLGDSSPSHCYNFLILVVVSFLVHHLDLNITCYLDSMKKASDKKKVAVNAVAESVAQHLLDPKLLSSEAGAEEQSSSIAKLIDMVKKKGLELSNVTQGKMHTHSLHLDVGMIQNVSYSRRVPCCVLTIIRATGENPLFTTSINEWYKKKFCSVEIDSNWIQRVLERICLTYINQRIKKKWITDILKTAETENNEKYDAKVKLLPIKPRAQKNADDDEYVPEEPPKKSKKRSSQKNEDDDQSLTKKRKKSPERQTNDEAGRQKKKGKQKKGDTNDNDSSSDRDNSEDIEPEQDGSGGDGGNGLEQVGSDDESEDGGSGLEAEAEAVDEDIEPEQEGSGGDGANGLQQVGSDDESEDGEQKQGGLEDEAEDEEQAGTGGDGEEVEGEKVYLRHQQYSEVMLSAKLMGLLDSSIEGLGPRLKPPENEPAENVLPPICPQKNGTVVNDITSQVRKKSRAEEPAQQKVAEDTHLDLGPSAAADTHCSFSVEGPITNADNANVDDVVNIWGKNYFKQGDQIFTGDDDVSDTLTFDFDFEECTEDMVLLSPDAHHNEEDISDLRAKMKILRIQHDTQVRGLESQVADLREQITSSRQSLFEVSIVIENIPALMSHESLSLKPISSDEIKAMDYAALTQLENNLCKEESSMVTEMLRMQTSQQLNACTIISILLSFLWLTKQGEVMHSEDPKESIRDLALSAIQSGEYLHKCRHLLPVELESNIHEPCCDLDLKDGLKVLLFALEYTGQGEENDCFPFEFDTKTGELDVFLNIQQRNELFHEFSKNPDCAALCKLCFMNFPVNCQSFLSLTVPPPTLSLGVLHGEHTFAFLKGDKQIFCVDTLNRNNSQAYVQDFRHSIQITVHMLVKTIKYLAHRKSLGQETGTLYQTSFTYMLIKLKKHQPGRTCDYKSRIEDCIRMHPQMQDDEV